VSRLFDKWEVAAVFKSPFIVGGEAFKSPLSKGDLGGLNCVTEAKHPGLPFTKWEVAAVFKSPFVVGGEAFKSPLSKGDLGGFRGIKFLPYEKWD